MFHAKKVTFPCFLFELCPLNELENRNPFCGFSIGSNQYWARLCKYFMTEHPKAQQKKVLRRSWKIGNHVSSITLIPDEIFWLYIKGILFISRWCAMCKNGYSPLIYIRFIPFEQILRHPR